VWHNLISNTNYDQNYSSISGSTSSGSMEYLLEATKFCKNRKKLVKNTYQYYTTLLIILCFNLSYLPELVHLSLSAFCWFHLFLYLCGLYWTKIKRYYRLISLRDYRFRYVLHKQLHKNIRFFSLTFYYIKMFSYFCDMYTFLVLREHPFQQASESLWMLSVQYVKLMML